MKKVFLFCCIAIAVLVSCDRNKTVDMHLTVDLNSQGAVVPASMYGIFFEEINHAGDGGLYAELLMNRSFEERAMPAGGYTVENGELVSPTIHNHVMGRPTVNRFKWGNDPHPGWKLSKSENATITLTTQSPNFLSAPTSMQIDIKEPVSLINSGYWGIAVKQNEQYYLRIFASTSAKYTGNITARLVGADNKVLAEKTITTTNDGTWKEYNEILIATDTSTVATLHLDLQAPGTVHFDYVSLFPEKTYKNRKNGLRPDIAQTLADLRPAFIRWPGGCIVEGISLGNRVEWKKTLGDPASRGGQYDTWGYHNTYGFGMKEFLDFCEDINAKGMYVCNVGLGCQARSGDACAESEVGFYVQDALDAIEYAIGDVSTTWGAVRAKEGHPEPYPLQYVEIGNENWGKVYDKRFDIFYAAIKARYPQLTLISNHGLGDGVKGVAKTDMIDPHWYVNPEFFFRNAGIFDKQPRTGATVYVGEYACNVGVSGGNMLAALSEAAFITGMERNSDLVTMTSYAPLLENVNDRGWPTNLIWFNNHAVVGRSSYYVQKMFAENMPTHNLQATAEIQPGPVEAITRNGYVGFGTWQTQSEYKNLKITNDKGMVVTPDLNDASQWTVINGDWTAKDGVYAQTGNQNMTSIIWNKEKFENCTIEFDARKQSGMEGFFLYFGLEKTDLSNGLYLNIGGWGNSSSAFQKVANDHGSIVSDQVPDKVELNQWYTIKLVVTTHKAEVYVNGEHRLTYEGTPVEKKFYVAGYDVQQNEIIIKVVNADTKPCHSLIDLKGADVEKQGKVITLSAASNKDENSFENPLQIAPVESAYNQFSNSFNYEFKPNSLTTFRIKKK